MSLYVIADLHLPGADERSKSMDVFGKRWANYRERLERNWRALLTDSDDIVIPGDISWAMNLEEALRDFELIDSLPGRKYIGKGNHDFWWTTASKMTAFFAENNFSTLNILYNNAYLVDGAVICGSRGWFLDESSQKAVGDVDWSKICAREAGRLKASLEYAVKIKAQSCTDFPIIAFLHFPPVWNGSVARDIVDVLHAYNISRCYFGHIHSEYVSRSAFVFEDIVFELISADHLSFTPRLVTL